MDNLLTYIKEEKIEGWKNLEKWEVIWLTLVFQLKIHIQSGLNIFMETCLSQIKKGRRLTAIPLAATREHAQR